MSDRTRRAAPRLALGLGFLAALVGIASSAAPARPAVPLGLRANWTFAEGSGTSAGDSSGNGFSGTLAGGTAWTPAGRLGSALSFDGVNDSVNLGSNVPFVNNAPAATVSCWIKPASTIAAGSFRELVSLSVNAGSPSNTSRVALSLQGDGTGGDLFAGGRSTDAESQKTLVADASLAVGTWHHVAAVIDFTGNTIKIYLNGALVATNGAAGFSSPTTPNTNSTSCALGAQDKGDSNFFHGLMDEVQISNRALTAAEVSVLASADALAAHWAFDEDAGLVASDSTGNRYDGTLRNGLAWTFPGQTGSALRFDGTNDWLDLESNLGILQNVNAATVTGWIKPASTMAPNSFRELVSISVNNGATATNTSRLALSLKGDGSAGDLFLGGRSTDAESQKSLTHDTNLQAGQWVHVAGVVDFQTGKLTLFLNGLQVASTTATFAQPRTANTPSTNAAIGAQDKGDSNFFHGDIDDVRVYSRALCGCEIQTLVGMDGLRAHYTFDEGSGTTASDASGNGYTGTLQNGPVWTAGQLAGAIQLDGTNDFVNLGANLDLLRCVPAATVAGWVKVTAMPGSGAYREILSLSVQSLTPTNVSRVAVALVGDGSAADIFAGARSTDTETQKSIVAAGANLAVDTWVHVAAVFDLQRNTIKIYKDGALSASGAVAFSSPITPDTASANGAIGAQDTGDSNFLAGCLDDLRIYCRALSATEVQSLAALTPAVPTGLAAVGGDQQVTLTWNASSGATSYNVKRAAASGGPYVTVGMANSPSFIDTGLTNNTTYYYKVSAENSSGESADSGFVPGTPVPPPIPDPPTLLDPVPGDTKVDLSWTASANATSYNVKRSLTSGSGFTVIATVTGTTYSDTGLTNGTTYYYRVTASNSSGTSGDSNEKPGAPAAPVTVPPAPTGLAGSPGDQTAALGWNASSGATSYRIKRSATSGSGYVQVGTSTGTSFTDTGLTNNTLYFYIVTAVNTAGESGPSNEASVRPNIPPAPPTGLTAVGGNTFVTLDWADNSETTLTGYNVYRSLTQNGPYTSAQKINASLVTVSNYTDTGLTNGTTYWYVVRAVNTSAQESGNSNEQPGIPTAGTPPAPPVITTANGKKTNDNTPQITGTSAANASITVYLNGLLDGTATANGSGAWTYHNVAATHVDGTYTVTATATVGSLTSGLSTSIQIELDTFVNPPTNVTATPRAGAIDVEWTPSTDPDVIGYKVYVSTTGTFGTYTLISTSQPVTGTKFRHGPGLSPTQEYCYKVTAVDNALNEKH